MATTIGVDSPGKTTQTDISLEVPKRPLVPAIRWGAIFAGLVVGISVQIALTLLGVATGLSIVDIASGQPVNTMAPLIWAAFSMLVAGFIGGYVAARMSGLKRKTDGMLHGAVSWAVTTLLIAAFATSVSGMLISGIFSTMEPAAAMRMSGGGAESPAAAYVRSQIGNVDPTLLQRWQQNIRAGQRDEAIRLMTGSMNVDPARAATIVDQALILSGSPAAASPESRVATERAAKNASAAVWAVFLAVILSLAVAIGGGLLGARGGRRAVWVGSVRAV
jgi:hypothetical protein